MYIIVYLKSNEDLFVQEIEKTGKELYGKQRI
jgi:hypothetical protein